ncbi:alpha/beta hydrolase family protein [Halobellus limi]|nr:alpha/beta hydrolase [Halobellus limi]
MKSRVPAAYVTAVLLVVTVGGIAGWLVPFVQTPNAGGSGYTVEHVYVRADDRITTATLYLPDGDEQVPGIVFGAGSGTAPALYTNYGAALATNGFAVLVAGQTRELETGNPIYWEIRRDTSNIFELAAGNYANWATYLASHPRVDEDRLVLAGHSGGANSAYRVAYERDTEGVVAIAGRFPPETDEPFPTNLLLATGSEDSLVPPSKLTNVSAQLTGTALQPGHQVGSFENGTATRVTVAEGATHLSEADDPVLVRESAEWALRSVGESPPETLDITVRSIGSVLYQFLFGLVGILAGTALTKRALASRLDDRQRRDGIVALVWLVGFTVILHTTVSQRVYHFGPMPAQATKYVLLGGLLLGIGFLLDRVASSRSWADSRVGSALFDLGFLVGPVGAFVLLSTQFVTFQLVTTVVLSSVALLVLAAVLSELAVLKLERRFRWTVVGIVVLWLVPAIVPPYL